MKERLRTPDKAKARDLLIAAQQKMHFTYTLPINDQSTSTIYPNIYECFRMLGEALLIAKGLPSQTHEQPINALMALTVDTPRPLGVLESLRNIRHNVNYRGYTPSIAEVKDATDFAHKCFDVLVQEIQKEIES
jgi:hypothetical protein